MYVSPSFPTASSSAPLRAHFAPATELAGLAHLAVSQANASVEQTRQKRPAEQELPGRQARASFHRRISIESLLNPSTPAADTCSAPSSPTDVSPPTPTTLPSQAVRPASATQEIARQVSLNRALQHLGMAAQERGNHSFATRMFEQSLTGLMALPNDHVDQVEAGSLMYNIAQGRRLSGQHDAALTLYRHAQALFAGHFPADGPIMCGLEQIIASASADRLRDRGTRD